MVTKWREIFGLSLFIQGFIYSSYAQATINYSTNGKPDIKSSKSR